MGVCNCSMLCCTLLCVRSSIAIILMGKRELVALLNLSSWCLVMVEWLFLAVPQGCLRFVIVVFPDHTHLLFLGTLPFNVCVNVQQFVLRYKGNNKNVKKEVLTGIFSDNAPLLIEVVAFDVEISRENDYEIVIKLRSFMNFPEI